MANTEERVFSITTTGEEKTSALVKRGKYDWTDGAIGDELFPIAPHEPEEREIVLISFDEHDPTSEDVLAEFEKRGLERPTTEDALVFGVTYPDEQKKAPIVFFHEPVRVRGGRRVLVLRGYARLRCLYLFWFGARWLRRCDFAAVRK